MAKERGSFFRRQNRSTKMNGTELSKQEIDRFRNTIDELTKKTTFLVDGTTKEFKDETEKEFQQVKDVIKNVTELYKEVTSDNLIEFITRTAIDADNDRQKISRLNNIRNKKLDLKKILESPNSGSINELYSAEKDRITKMDEFDKIVHFIPQLSQALTVLVDNIMSPDDFTKDVFTLRYNSIDVKDDESKDAVIFNLKELEKMYKIEEKTKQLITDTLKYGDQFLSILKLNKEFNRLFGENGELLPLNEEMQILTEDTVVLSEDEEKEFKKLLEDEGIKYDGDLRKDIAKMINENIEFTKNPLSLYEEELILEADFNMTTSMAYTDKWEDEETTKHLAKSKPGYNKSLADKITDRKSLFSFDNPLITELENEVRKNPVEEEMKKKRRGYVTGSYVKPLDPRKVVKIWMNGTCYGYYHLETELDTLKITNYSNSVSIATAFQVKAAADINTNNAGEGKSHLDAKSKLILDVFLKNISKKLNKRFIERNSQFKSAIYDLLQKEYITKKKVKITYLSPEEVEHFHVNLQDDGYGRSVFEKILFTAKIYLATLTTTLMLKLSRSADHRTFYIEAGLSNDLEGIVQDFVREIKGKEVKMNDLNGSVDTILNTIGQFHDYYIPQIDGQKTIDIDTTPGQQVDMDNDLLEYLKKAMISGMGIPASFLNYSDEMEFARSVSMMNGMFLRLIIGYQKSLSEAFSNTYRKLYKNEYENTSANTRQENKALVVDYKLIEATFPSPATLNMTNLNEQIGSGQTIVEYIVNVLIGTQTQDEKKRDYMVREVTKDVMPNIDWSKYEEILENYKINRVEETLKDAVEQGVSMDDPMAGGGDMGMQPPMQGDDMGMQPPMDGGGAYPADDPQMAQQPEDEMY